MKYCFVLILKRDRLKVYDKTKNAGDLSYLRFIAVAVLSEGRNFGMIISIHLRLSYVYSSLPLAGFTARRRFNSIMVSLIKCYGIIGVHF